MASSLAAPSLVPAVMVHGTRSIRLIWCNALILMQQQPYRHQDPFNTRITQCDALRDPGQMVVIPRLLTSDGCAECD